jgi:hypothetical protein
MEQKRTKTESERRRDTVVAGPLVLFVEVIADCVLCGVLMLVELFLLVYQLEL